MRTDVLQTDASWSGDLTPGHLDHIPPERQHDPVLVDVTTRTAYRDRDGAPGEPVQVPFPVLIDGHHRAALSVREGFPLLGYVLTPAESRAVVTVHEGEYDPELMGWRTREEAEALPFEPNEIRTGGL
jgi:hypothetical protein